MFEKILGKKQAPIDIDFDFDTESRVKHSVKVVRLQDMRDVENLRMKLSNHDVFFCNIQAFKDLDDLKRAISRIKVQVSKYGGDVFGLDSRWLLITTENAIVER